MNLTTRFIAMGVALAAIALHPLHAQVALAPQMADFSLDGPGKTHSFRLSNEAKLPMHVVVTVSNWTMDADGKVDTATTTEQSLDSWVQINPTRFTVLPGQSQVVRYAIRPAVPLVPGEHRAMIFFTEDPDAAAKAKPATLRVYFRIGAAIYAHVGPVHRSGDLVALGADAQTAVFTLRNTGNATSRMIGQYALWRADTYPAQGAVASAQLDTAYRPPKGLLRFGKLPQDAVLPDAVRRSTLSLGKVGLSPGHYVLAVEGTFGDSALNRVLRFDVPDKKGGP